MKLIALASAEIKPVYYPGEERLMSLDVLKLNGGEDIIHQNPEDVDSNRLLNEGELVELSEIPTGRNRGQRTTRGSEKVRVIS